MTSQMVGFLADILPELVLAGGGIVVLFVALFTSRRFQPMVAIPASLVLGVAGVFAAADIIDPPGLTFFDTLAADGVGRWATLLLVVVGLLTVALSVEWFRSDARHGEYYTLLIFATLGPVLLGGASDLMELVVAMILASVAAYTLAAFHRRSRNSSEAGIKYFLLGGLANGALVYGVALLFGLGGTTTYPGLGRGFEGADALGLVVGFGLVTIGLAFKMGAAPVHPWVPDVAEGAPAPAAAFLMVVGKVGALLALARLVLLIPDTAVGWRPLVALLAAVTMTLGNLAALWQDDVRRLLGWSSVSQVGYGLLAIVALGRSDLAVPSLLMFLVAYALGTIAVFGVVVELRGLTDRQGYLGLAGPHPWLMAALALGFLSFVGIPPLGGFAAKLLLMGAVIEAGYTWLAVLTVINSVISLFYYLRVIGPAYLGAPAAPRALLGNTAGAAVAVAAVGVVVVGLVAEPLLSAWRLVTLLPG